VRSQLSVEAARHGLCFTAIRATVLVDGEAYLTESGRFLGVTPPLAGERRGTLDTTPEMLPPGPHSACGFGSAAANARHISRWSFCSSRPFHGRGGDAQPPLLSTFPVTSPATALSKGGFTPHWRKGCPDECCPPPLDRPKHPLRFARGVTISPWRYPPGPVAPKTHDALSSPNP
jgi:hypothetical protein